MRLRRCVRRLTSTPVDRKRMSMADDRLRAHRSNERRGGRPDDDASGDPLAELARLIGQSDPFSDYGRRDGRDSAPRNPQSRAPSSSDWRRTAASMPPYDAPEEPVRPSRSEPRFSDQDLRQESHRESHRESYRDSYRQDPYRMAEEEPDRRHDRYEEERPSQYRREPQFADDEYHPREDERTYDSRDQHSEQGYFEDDGPLSAQEDDAYDDPPRKRRRGGLLTAVTLIACAMIGTAGAYGYRYYSNPSSGRVPPVISAETSPTKVVSATEGPTGKFIQDRVRDVAPPERVVSREEEPVELRTPSSSSRVPSGGFPPAGKIGRAHV